jgi:hypothetical protein
VEFGSEKDAIEVIDVGRITNNRAGAFKEGAVAKAMTKTAAHADISVIPASIFTAG